MIVRLALVLSGAHPNEQRGIDPRKLIERTQYTFPSSVNCKGRGFDTHPSFVSVLKLGISCCKLHTTEAFCRYMNTLISIIACTYTITYRVRTNPLWAYVGTASYTNTILKQNSTQINVIEGYNKISEQLNPPLKKRRSNWKVFTK